MESRGALAGRKTRQLKFLERAGWDRGNFFPMPNFLRQGISSFAKPAIWNDTLKLKTKKFECEIVEIWRWRSGNKIADSRADFGKCDLRIHAVFYSMAGFPPQPAKYVNLLRPQRKRRAEPGRD